MGKGVRMGEVKERLGKQSREGEGGIMGVGRKERKKMGERSGKRRKEGEGRREEWEEEKGRRRWERGVERRERKKVGERSRKKSGEGKSDERVRERGIE